MTKPRWMKLPAPPRAGGAKPRMTNDGFADFAYEIGQT